MTDRETDKQNRMTTRLTFSEHDAIIAVHMLHVSVQSACTGNDSTVSTL